MLHNKLRAGLTALAVAAGAAAFLPGIAGASPLTGTTAAVATTATRPVSAAPVTSAPVTGAPVTGASSVHVPTSILSFPRPIVTQIPIPAAPGEYALQTSQGAVVVPWYDRSTDEQSFIVYRRDASGNWQNVYQVATRDETGQGDSYSWVDTDLNQSGQCYMIAAVGILVPVTVRRSARSGRTRRSSLSPSRRSLGSGLG